MNASQDPNICMSADQGVFFNQCASGTSTDRGGNEPLRTAVCFGSPEEAKFGGRLVKGSSLLLTHYGLSNLIDSTVKGSIHLNSAALLCQPVIRSVLPHEA